MSKRSYSDNEKAEVLAALDANGGNVSGTSQQVKIPRKTLSEWAHDRFINTDVAEIRRDKKISLADKFENIANMIVDAMPDKIEKAGLKDSAIAAGTAVDKARLLRGESTENQAHQIIGQFEVLYVNDWRKPNKEVQSYITSAP